MPSAMNQKERPHKWTIPKSISDDVLMKTFVVTEMTCANCVRHVTEADEIVAGVDRVVVDLATGTVQIQGDPDSAAVISAIVAAGYQATE